MNVNWMEHMSNRELYSGLPKVIVTRSQVEDLNLRGIVDDALRYQSASW